ncbi:hypothetical protein V8F20_006832 [Naviculisporaceae sp. PSN 640]
MDEIYQTFTPGSMPPVPEDEFCVFGIVFAHPNQADALEEVYAETTRLAASEPGTLQYCIARDPDNRDASHFYERYTGRVAFEAHNSQPVIVQLLGEGKLIREVKFKFVKPVGAAKV